MSEQAKCAACGVDMWTSGPVPGIGHRHTAHGYECTRNQLATQAAEIERRDDLISHIWVHANMGYTVEQMTTEQRELYDAIIADRLLKIGI